MDIVILGAGNLASIFGQLLSQNKYKIIQIVGKTTHHAAALAEKLKTSYTTDVSKIYDHAQMYLFALPDNLIQEVAAHEVFQHKLLVHTAGSVPATVFKNFTDNYGVLWPIQSLHAESPTTINFPLSITASNTFVLNSLLQLSKCLTTGEVVVLSDEQKEKLHLSAVFASNFTNYLYHIAFNYCKEQGLPFSLLIPLIHQTATRINETTVPIALQTGPAFRNDSNTILKHLLLLKNHPEYEQFYQLFTKNISKEGIKKQIPQQ